MKKQNLQTVLDAILKNTKSISKTTDRIDAILKKMKLRRRIQNIKQQDWQKIKNIKMKIEIAKPKKNSKKHYGVSVMMDSAVDQFGVSHKLGFKFYPVFDTLKEAKELVKIYPEADIIVGVVHKDIKNE